MNAPPGPLSNDDVNRASQVMRAERPPARKRDKLMPRVRAARKRLMRVRSSG